MSSHELEDDKVQDVEVTQGRKTPSTTDESTPSGVDAAWTFLNEHRGAAASDVPVNIDALRRKIDLHIVPLMFLCYTMQFLDKVILNVSPFAPCGVSHDTRCTDSLLHIVCRCHGHQGRPQARGQ